MSTAKDGRGHYLPDQDIPPSWCGRHYARFAIPALRVRVAEPLLEEFMLLPQVITFCGFNPLTGQKADQGKLMEALRVFSPICCLLGDEVMNRLYQEAAFGRREPPRDGPSATLDDLNGLAHIVPRGNSKH